MKRVTMVVVLFCLAANAGGESLRSALYPADWTPEYTDGEGRFLHDFSYAGYHNGEIGLPPNTGGTIFNVVEGYGADNTGATDATGAIQTAIMAAEGAGGGVVYFPAGLYRCDGRLYVSQSNMTLRGAGPESTFVYFTAPGGYISHLNFHGNVNTGVEALLATDGENRSKDVHVADASGLTPGQDVALGWVITDEFVQEHGMTGVWNAFNGTWQPILLRKVVAVDMSTTPHKVTLDVPLRYPAKVRDAASLRVQTGYISECVLEDMSLSDATDFMTAWTWDQDCMAEFWGVKDGVMRNIRSFSAPVENTRDRQVASCGLKAVFSKRVTIANCHMEKAQNRGGGGNGYLYLTSQSSDILIRDCVGRDGRHNFIQGWGFGATGLVWLRCISEGSKIAELSGTSEFGTTGYSEYHHSLATACLVDSCTFGDGWAGGNRLLESSGAGHCATQDVCWNTQGRGSAKIRSFNYGYGYVIGTKSIQVLTTQDIPFGSLNTGTDPEDYRELIDQGDLLAPQSLYEDQLKRRLGQSGEGEGEGVGEITMDPAPPIVEGTKVTLTAPDGFDFLWDKDLLGKLKDAPPRLTGVYTRTLVLDAAQVSDSGSYTCIYNDGSKRMLITKPLELEVEAYNPVPVASGAGLALLALCMVGMHGYGRRRK